MKKKDGLVGKKALELVTRWKHKFSPKKNDNHTDKDRKELRNDNDKASKIHKNDEKKEINEHRSDKTKIEINHDKMQMNEKINRNELRNDTTKIGNNHNKVHKNEAKISRTEHKSDDSKVTNKHKQDQKEKSEKPKMASFKKPPDHWKDVSLNLLADPSKKVKKKRKAMNGDVSESPSKKEKQLPVCLLLFCLFCLFWFICI